ncbi:hypothetical protein [Aerolutibacter daejeonensis]|uniref:hypothetical protein n=1 Tax=Aerolutibacter daejeonensis TaxID=346181 RepID=UPI0012EC82E9|nr:hypothetical protein [Lysobacter daejeonensis]
MNELLGRCKVAWLLARWNGMASSDLGIADDTDDGHAIEIPKSIRHVSLQLEFILAQVAPCLQVTWVAAVLDESGWSRLPF